MSIKLTICVAALCALGFETGALQAEPLPPTKPANTVARQALTGAPGYQPSVGLLSHAEYTGEVVHLIAGRSMFVSILSRLRRISVGNPAVLDSVTASPHRIFITAKAPGTSSLLLTDEQGRSQAYLVMVDVDVVGLRNNLEKAFPGDQIKVESLEDRVLVSGTIGSDAAADAALKLAGLYSKNVANAIVVNPSHIKQVKLDVRIVEVDRSKLEQFGVNFISGGKNISATSTGQFPVSTSLTGATGAGASGSTLTLSDPLNLFFYHSPLNIGVTIKDLESRMILQILAEPNITTLSGQKASFLAGGEFPFPVVQGTAGGLASVTIQFKPYGVKLDFTPLVNPDGTIQLKVSPEVSALDYTNAVTISGYTVPAISTRRADTQVELRDGQSFAISGLLDHRTTEMLSKIPGIGDVPLLGRIFKSKSMNFSTVELIVIVTPTIVNPLTDEIRNKEPTLPVGPINNSSFDKIFTQPDSTTRVDMKSH